jgi:hypothetical protein
VAGAVEGIGTGTTQLRPELLQQLGMSKQFVLHVFRQDIKFGLELLMQEDFPCHPCIMSYKTYAVKYIMGIKSNRVAGRTRCGIRRDLGAA